MAMVRIIVGPGCLPIGDGWVDHPQREGFEWIIVIPGHFLNIRWHVLNLDVEQWRTTDV
jgi:hypothetical protein